MRQLLLVGLPLLLPFAIYALWFERARTVALRQGLAGPRLQDAPLVVLTGCGVVLAVIFLFGFWLFEEQEKNGTYVPPRVIDGQVVPGHVDPGHVPPK